jgi:hypothetical protein
MCTGLCGDSCVGATGEEMKGTQGTQAHLPNQSQGQHLQPGGFFPYHGGVGSNVTFQRPADGWKTTKLGTTAEELGGAKNQVSCTFSFMLRSGARLLLAEQLLSLVGEGVSRVGRPFQRS